MENEFNIPPLTGKEELRVTALIELFGHGKIAGFVTEFQISGATFIRVDVPETPNQKGFTRLLNPGAIYAINPVTAEIMLAMARKMEVKPIELWDISEIIKSQIKSLKEQNNEEEN
jgi:hypothetical protein